MNARMMPRVIVLLSGGMDSTTLLYHVLVDRGYDVEAVSFDYGQRHLLELRCAKALTKRLDLPHKIFEIDLRQVGGSPLTDPTSRIPDQTECKQRDTVVPFRNAIFIVYAAAYASQRGITALFISAVLDDYRSYRDCRREFFDALERTLQLGAKEDNNEFRIHTPFITKTKAAIVHEGVSLQVPYELTHTCYRGTRPACGTCDACRERIAAFQANGLTDPLEYEIEIDWGAESL
jgi:7-cyano-7-deazaguanine synthase